MKDRTLALLTSASFVGVIWLIWLANHVTEHAAHESGSLFFLSTRLVAIYTPQRLVEFAKAQKSFGNHDELIKTIHESGLSKSWFALVLITRMSDETSYREVVIVHPGEIQQTHLFASIIEAFRVLSGKSENPVHAVEIRRIADSQLEEDPFSVVADLEEANR
jgi:hypothetical protein